MNCFPCKGPTCNSCKKYDRIMKNVQEGGFIRCTKCGEAINIETGICPACGSVVINKPGTKRREN